MRWLRGETTLGPLGLSQRFVLFQGMGEGDAQLCPDDQNIPSMRAQERHMPLPINCQRDKVFTLSVRFCGKRALLA